ncbi:MAG: hypothetical protein MUC65_07230 [Pontiellaceae bacterium]|jgi:hypothetical protein|nr:hypothetical protein [Pontiellaceae bacterium]
MRKNVNSALASGGAAVFCAAATVMVGRQAEGAFSLMGNLDIFAFHAALLFLIFHFFKLLRYYLVFVCLLAGVGLCSVLGSVSDGRLLLVTVLFFCLGAGSVSMKKVYFFPLRKAAMPLGGWVAVFVLLDVLTELISGNPVAEVPVKFRVIALAAGLALGGVGRLVRSVAVKQYGEGVESLFLLDPTAWPTSILVPKAKPAAYGTSVKPAAGTVSVPLPKREESPDTKKSILDAKLAAMCGGTDAKSAAGAPSKGAGGAASSGGKTPGESASKVSPKATTETGKIVSSVDFS